MRFITHAKTFYKSNVTEKILLRHNLGDSFGTIKFFQ